MKGVNLSEWALKHQQMIAFLLLLLTIAGVLAYGSLGQKEDPEFTIKTMVVQAYWPGSSAQQMADQVTDKLEKKLQEVAEIDYTASYVQARAKRRSRSTCARRRRPPRCPTSGTRCARRSATSAHTLPQGVQGPFFNDEFGDTFGNLYAITGDGFGYARAARVRRRGAQRVPARAPTSTRSTSWASRTRRSTSRPRTPSWPRWGSTRR